MHLSQIRLFHFRNLEEQSLSLHKGAHAFVGNNGQGKTNLVEAINLLSVTRSFRTNIVREVVRWQESEASVFGVVQSSSHEPFELGIAIESGRRQAFVYGEKVASLSDYLGRLLCVAFSPTDLEIIKGPPAQRRSFVDQHILEMDPKILHHYQGYTKALKSKSRILREGAGNSTMLDSWDELLAEHGTEIIRTRKLFLKKLSSVAGPLYQDFGGEQEKLTLELRTIISFDEESEIRKELLFEHLQKYREREIAIGAIVAGPHRDDIIIKFGGKDARSFASQGQTRSMVLCLKLAVLDVLESATQRQPIVVLDDVDSELDPRRRDVLLQMILGRKHQVFITCTASSEWLKTRNDALQFWSIEGGKITPGKDSA